MATILCQLRQQLVQARPTTSIVHLNVLSSPSAPVIFCTHSFGRPALSRTASHLRAPFNLSSQLVAMDFERAKAPTTLVPWTTPLVPPQKLALIVSSILYHCPHLA